MELITVFAFTFIYLAFSYSAIRKDKSNHTNLLFAAFSFFSGLWLITNYFSLNSTHSETLTLFWIKAVLFLTTPYASIVALLGKVFPKEKLNLSIYEKIYFILGTLIVMVFMASPYSMSSVKIDSEGNITPTPSFGMIFYGAFAFFNLGYMIYHTARNYIKNKGIEKVQIQYFFSGIGISLILGVITNLILVTLFKYSGLVQYGPLFLIFFVITTSYAIRRYQLFDIRYLINQILSRVILTIFIVALYYGIYFLQTTLWGTLFSTESYLTGFVWAFLFVQFFTPFNRVINRFVDKELLKGEYDLEEIFNKLSDDISVTIELEELTQIIGDTISSGMGIENTLIYLIQSQTGQKQVLSKYTKYWNGVPKELDCINIDLNLIYTMYNQYKSLSTLELLYLSKNKNFQTLKECNIDVVMPIKVKKDTFFLILLGSKVSDTAFNKGDFEFFANISKPISVALERGFLYRETQQFAQTLQKEVDRATKELQIANQQLKELDSLKDDLISIAGHELRTPATVIMNNLYLLEQAINNPEKRPIYLKRMREGVRREVEMITNLLEASRFGKRTVALQPEEFDFFEMVHTATDELKYLADQKNIELKFIIPSDKTDIDMLQKKGFTLQPKEKFVGESLIIEADKSRLREVIDNLITNASKYTNQGWIKVWITEDDQNTWFYIQDTGVGIKPEFQSTLFEKFSRVKNTSESGIVRPGGTGLGLYVAKSIINMHKGDIKVKSQGIPGEGSLFYFNIPKKFVGQLKQSEMAAGTSYTE